MGPKEFAVIGDPIAHSLSPELFAFVFRALGVADRYRYRALRVTARELPDVLKRVREGRISGINVTIPHKERVIFLLDALDERAAQTGAVNTVARVGGELKGYNTDVGGFMRALREAHIHPRGKRAVVLGAGGAARAVLFALVEMGIVHLTVGNRTRERAERLVSELRMKTGFAHLDALELHAPRLIEAIRGSSLLVNATPVGMHPNTEGCPLPDPSALHPGLVVVDLVYHPLETRLLQEARKRGARTLDGLPMLIHQALEALEIWTQGELRWGGPITDIREHLTGILRKKEEDEKTCRSERSSST